MKRKILFGMVLIFTAVFTACGNSGQITLESMKKMLEDTGEYEISEHYIPSDHDYPLAENTAGGFSFYAKTDNGELSSSTSVMVMEFKDRDAADDYTTYLYTNKDFWITTRNGEYLIAAFNQNERVDASEILFLDELLFGNLVKEKPAVSEGILGMIFLLFFGVIFSAVGFFSIKSNKRLKEVCTSRTKGTVIEIQRRRSGGRKSTTSYYPVYSYTVKEIPYEKSSSIGTPKPRFTIGQKVNVLYNPANPDDFYAEEDGLSNTIFYIFLVIGILIIIAALFIPNLYN